MFGITDKMDKEIRDRQGAQMIKWLYNNVPGNPIARWNYPTCIVWETDEPDKIVERLNSFAILHQKATRFEATDSVDELRFNKRMLLVSWKPYKWEDENGSFHYIKSLQAIDKIAHEYDVFDIYTVDGKYIGNLFEAENVYDCEE